MATFKLKSQASRLAMAERFVNDGYGYAARIDNLRQAALASVVISGCAVSQHTSPNMSVDIAAGTIFNGSAAIGISAVTKNVDAADSTNPRLDIISISASGTVNYTAGTAASLPKPPNLPSGDMLLAIILINSGETSIQTSAISDCRMINANAKSANTALLATAENRVRIVRLEGNASIGADNFEGSYADFFSDSSGYYNTIDTGATTSQYNSGGKYYYQVAAGSNASIQDNFTDGDYTNSPTWTVVTGTWSAAGNNLKYTENGSDGRIYASCSRNLSSSSTIIQFKINTPRTGNLFVIIGSGSTHNLNTESGYDLLIDTNGKPYWRYHDGAGGNTNIITGSNGDVATSTDTIIKITRTSGGTWELFVDDVSKGTASDTNVTSISQFWLDFRAQNIYIDDIIVCDTLTSSASIIKTIDLSTLAAPSANINGIFVYVSKADGDDGQEITGDISVDNGSHYLTSQPINQWIALSSNLGTHPVIKINVPSSGNTRLNGFAVFYTTG